MSSTDDQSLPAQLTKYAVCLLMLLIILTSVLGNLLVCIAIYTERRLRKLGNLFLASLALADLFVGLLVMSISLASRLIGRWTFGATFCRMWIAFDVMCCTSSILHLCAICTDRFLHIKDPYAYTQYMHKRLVILVILGIWSLSALISFLPLSLGWHQWGLQPLDSNDFLTDLGDQTGSWPVHINYTAEGQVKGSGVGITWSQTSFKGQNSIVRVQEQLEHLREEERRLVALNQAETQRLEVLQQQQQQLLFRLRAEQNEDQCNLEFSPIYAVVSSCISFYLPCLVMVALYTRLYLYARKHVRDIKRTMCKPAPPPPINHHHNQHNHHHPNLHHTQNQPPPPPTPVCPSAPTFNRPDAMRQSSTSSSHAYSQPQQQQPQTDSNRLQVKQTIRPSVSNTVLPSTSQSIVDHKAAITIGIIMGSFLFCWVPFFLMNITLSVCKNCVSDLLFNLLTWLGWCNSALNPLIYSFFHTEFRRAFHRILTLAFCPRVNNNRATVCTLLPNKQSPKTARQQAATKAATIEKSRNAAAGSPARLKSTLSSEPLHSPNDKQQQKLNVIERQLAHSHSQPSLPNSAQSVIGQLVENAQAV